MIFLIRTFDGYEVERDHWDLAQNGLVIDGSVYGPEMIEFMKPVETEKQDRPATAIPQLFIY